MSGYVGLRLGRYKAHSWQTRAKAFKSLQIVGQMHSQTPSVIKGFGFRLSGWSLGRWEKLSKVENETGFRLLVQQMSVLVNLWTGTHKKVVGMVNREVFVAKICLMLPIEVFFLNFFLSKMWWFYKTTDWISAHQLSIWSWISSWPSRSWTFGLETLSS